MNREDYLLRKIEDFRMNLEAVIKEKEELVNPEVIKASQSVDRVLLQYYRILGMRSGTEPV